MSSRNIILADPAFLAQTNLDFGSAGSFFEDFETNNNTDWEGIEVIESPVDFSAAESTYDENFDDDWGFSGGAGAAYLSANTYGGRPIVWYNIQAQALGLVTSLPNAALTGQLGDATGDLTVPGSSNGPQCLLAVGGAIDGRQYIEFDAANLEALQGSLTTSRATGCFFAMVIRMRAATAAVQHVLDGDDATNRMTLSANATGSGADWMINSGASQTSGAAIEEEKWVRVVGRFGANGALNVERARHITGSSGTNTLDGITLGCRYDETLYGGFDLAEFIMWENEGDDFYITDGADNHLGMAGWLLEYNFPFEAVAPGNPLHWYSPDDYALAANVNPTDKGSGGENLTGTAFEVAKSADCPERNVFKFNGTTSRAVDDGTFAMTGDDHLFATMIRPAAAGLGAAQHIFASDTGLAWSVGLNSSNAVVRDFGTAQAGDDLDTLAPFASAERWCNIQALTLASAGSGTTYVDGNASGVADEGDNDPADLSIGAQNGAGYYEGETSDLLIYTGVNEANAARAAQVQDWLRRNRRLATLPTAATAPFFFDAERMIGGVARPYVIPNYGTEDGATVLGATTLPYISRAASLPVIPNAPRPDGTGSYVQDFVNVGAESTTAFSAIAQPAGFAVVGAPKPGAQFSAQRKSIVSSGTASTEWLVALNGLGTFSNSEADPFIDAGTVLTATGGVKWQSYQIAKPNWIAGEFNGATSHIGDSLGNSAAGDAGSEDLGTKLRLFIGPAGTFYGDWQMNVIVIAPGVSYEKLVEWLQTRYPNLDRQAT